MYLHSRLRQVRHRQQQAKLDERQDRIDAGSAREGEENPAEAQNDDGEPRKDCPRCMTIIEAGEETTKTNKKTWHADCKATHDGEAAEYARQGYRCRVCSGQIAPRDMFQSNKHRYHIECFKKQHPEDPDAETKTRAETRTD